MRLEKGGNFPIIFYPGNICFATTEKKQKKDTLYGVLAYLDAVEELQNQGIQSRYVEVKIKKGA